MSDMANKDIKLSFRDSKMNEEKLKFLARHDDTSLGQQLRLAVRCYINNRKKTVYPVNGHDPLNQA